MVGSPSTPAVRVVFTASAISRPIPQDPPTHALPVAV